MGSNTMRQQVAAMRQALFDEEILDNQFAQMEQLEDVDNPNFTEEVMNLYFRDSAKLLADVDIELGSQEYQVPRLDRMLHQLKGSSASVGAKKVRNETNMLREVLRIGDHESIKAQLEEIRRAHETLKERMEAYFGLLRQAGPAETAERPQSI